MTQNIPGLCLYPRVQTQPLQHSTEKDLGSWHGGDLREGEGHVPQHLLLGTEVVPVGHMEECHDDKIL